MSTTQKPLRSLIRYLLETPGRLPKDWAPPVTTYDLPRFHGHDGFIARFKTAAAEIEAGADPVVALAAAGLPYDYARLGTPWTSVYELYIEELTGAARAISFASRTKAFLAPLEVPGRTGRARVLHRGDLPISAWLRARWTARGVTFPRTEATDVPRGDADVLTLFVTDTAPEDTDLDAFTADAVVCPVTDGGVLLLRRPEKFDATGIQLIRKRTVSALLAITAQTELTRLVGLQPQPVPTATDAECDTAMAANLKGMTGGAYFCTGLAAEAAVFTAAADIVSTGAPVPLFYAENGYGGTGQLIADILSADDVVRASPLRVLGVDGQTLVDRVIEQLDGPLTGPAVVFLETPTNPELQVHDFPRLVQGLKRYEARTGLRIPVLVDTTMAPLYPLFEKDWANGWPFLIVKSGSKYISRGKATLGLVLAGEDPMARQILERTRAHGQDADSFAKPAQRRALVDGVADLRPRMLTIAANTRKLADRLLQELARRGHPDILLYTMSPEQVAQGLHSGLISFYLPAAATDHDNLCDAFVAWLLEHAPAGLVQNRVSYGQSSGGEVDPFYVINPEESTQGALAAEVKEAQKRGGVQICRISVPARADIDALMPAITSFFDATYGPPR
ncbi:MAG: PLP-dependent transferase [Alphaproteobacteria bacterium]|nr:PLP-dependent transferase [Alphaproteobacteria bacterium]